MASEPSLTPGARMIYLIKRKSGTSREELVMHWFANHMPIVIENQKISAKGGRRHATKYITTLFDTDKKGRHPWDGMAQLWFDKPLRKPKVPHGTEPTDTFQQKAEPYVGWATREFVIIDGELPVEPLTLNDPFPTTRTGFYKKIFLVPAIEGTDFDEFFEHWLLTHVPNVYSVMEEVGGFRYCVGHSFNPESEQYAGIAELYFPDVSGWETYKRTIQPDGMEKWVDVENMLVLTAQTEMIGIP